MKKKEENKTVKYLVIIGLVILFGYIWFSNRGFDGMIKEPFEDGWNKNLSPNDPIYIKQ